MSDENTPPEQPEKPVEAAQDSGASSPEGHNSTPDESQAAPAATTSDADVITEPTGEMMDRDERRALKKAAREKAAAERKAKAEPDEIDKALAAGKLGERKKLKRKKQIKMAGIGAGVLFLFWAGSYLFSPYQADLRFGICKTYLETSVRFPKYLRLSTVEDVIKSNVEIYPVRIWYTQLDAFGEYRMENIQCEFKYDETAGTIIDKILINRREVDQDRVAKFNTTIPIIASNPPDLTYPAPLPDSLRDLQINADQFRFQLGLPSF